MKDRLAAFLTDLDRTLQREAKGQRLDVYHIGRSALVWEYGSGATTQDIDILRPRGDAWLLEIALRFFGKATTNAEAYGLYLDVVEEGLPPMPFRYRSRATRVDGPWEVLCVYHLDPYDLIASKLRRFSAKDRADIRLLCDLVSIEPRRLEQVLEEAYPFNMEKDGDEFRDAAFRSLRTVQRYLRHEIREF